jgi:hypothetical protein
MNAEIFAEWLRRQGRHVVKTPSSYWYNAGARVFQAFPFHWIIQPSETELRDLMVSQRIVAIRYSTPLASQAGMVSYHVVVGNPYSLEMLPHQARTNIRKGLKHCNVEPISFSRLAEEGWLLQQDTITRQGRNNSMSQDEWKKICLSAEHLPGFEAWGAIVNGELAATLLTARIDDRFCVPYAQCNRNFLDLRVNNALFYVVSCELLSREGISGIFFSLHSLDAPESVNEFKFRMGFSPLPVRQRVVFHPLFTPFANRESHRVVSSLLNRYPGNYLFSKAEGILRFYINGETPIAEQEWPGCLADSKDSLLESLGVRTPQMIEVGKLSDQYVEMQAHI